LTNTLFIATKVLRKNLSTEEILKIKEIARLFFTSGEVIHKLPGDFDFKTPNPSSFYSYQDLETKIVKGPLDDIVKTWIAARAKTKWNLNIRYAVTVIVHFIPRVRNAKTRTCPLTSGNAYLRRRGYCRTFHQRFGILSYVAFQ